MTKKTEIIDEGLISFQSEGRLLQELGERLVASPEVAVVELIKNSYDADSSFCEVILEESDSLTIQDSGHGISIEEFKEKWMRIATGEKQKAEHSRKYKRKLTGAKGIGRFAARVLATNLKLVSVAYDHKKKYKTQVEASFNWSKFDKSPDISSIKIPYKYSQVPPDTKLGTTLILSKFRETPKDIFNRDVLTKILKIVSPFTGLDRGPFEKKKKKREFDPGFKVVLPFESEDEAVKTLNLAKNVLDNYVLKLTISLIKENLNYKIFFNERIKPSLDFSIEFKNKIQSGLHADIRFFPRRSGTFSGKDVNGRAAWTWIRENSGVAIIDHGFRIKPFGYKEDDWLKLSADKAVNTRNWRSYITKEYFPIPKEIKKCPADNPMLYLPGNHQLVGAVFVESGKKDHSIDLTPSTDREGFLANRPFEDLTEIIRTGMELVAIKDKEEKERKLEVKAKQETEKAREDIKKTIDYIKRLPTLTKNDKNKIIAEYTYLAENIDELEDYSRQARQGLETMSLLGVVAGYMTHECQRILSNLREAIGILEKLSKKNKELRQPLSKVQESYNEFSDHLDYTSTFIGATQKGGRNPFKAYSQIKRIIEKFDLFAKQRRVKIQIEVETDLMTPSISVPVYSGILLNLYTNALKSVIAGPTSNGQPLITFKGWNEPKHHVIEVLDNGIGIPENMGNRIWDPLFTTTSKLNNPLGSGMGLGLSLVKKLVDEMGGSISLIKPPTGYSTCFKLSLRRQG